MTQELLDVYLYEVKDLYGRWYMSSDESASEKGAEFEAKLLAINVEIRKAAALEKIVEVLTSINSSMQKKQP